MFEDSVIQSARQGSDITGLYYQNDIESLQIVEKLQQSFTKKGPNEVAETLQVLHNRQQVEERRAVYGAGKYVLAPEYIKFMVESSTWHTWSEKRKRDHIAAFKAYQPTISESYQKSKNAGRKPNEFTRTRPHGDPDVVVSRIEEEPSTAPIKVNLQKTPKGKHWMCRDCDIDDTCRFEDPRASAPKIFELHLRQKVPSSISKCQGNCGQKIILKDTLLVKSFGTSTWTDRSTGKERSRFGPMYVHFKDACLKNYDDEYYSPDSEFNYGKVTVDSSSKSEMTSREKQLLKNLGVKVD